MSLGFKRLIILNGWTTIVVVGRLRVKMHDDNLKLMLAVLLVFSVKLSFFTVAHNILWSFCLMFLATINKAGVVASHSNLKGYKCMIIKVSPMLSGTQNTLLAVVLLSSWLRYNSYIRRQTSNCPFIEEFFVLQVINSTQKFCFLDRAFSIWNTKINQQNAQINSGLIYYWSITPTCFGPSVEAIIREFEILESYQAMVFIC